MAYTPQEWRDGDSDTPLSAERLNHIEQGIADIELQKGDEGPPGKDAENQFTAEEVAALKALIEDTDE